MSAFCRAGAGECLGRKADIRIDHQSKPLLRRRDLNVFPTSSSLKDLPPCECLAKHQRVETLISRATKTRMNTITGIGLASYIDLFTGSISEQIVALHFFHIFEVTVSQMVKRTNDLERVSGIW